MTLRRSWFVLGVAVLLTVVAGFLLLPTTHSSAQVQEGATMTVLRGQVAVVHTDGSAVQPAPSGTLVNAGDEIRTLGSTSALITFFAGTEIELDQNTIIAIEQVSKQGDRIDVSLKQAFGTTVNRVQTLTGSGSTYRIDAGGAVALVRGTTFVVIGPITTSSGTDVVILVCGADCSAVSTFAGCPLAPYVGYGVLVEKGQVVSPCMVFAVSHTADLTSAAFEAITTIEQQVQGDIDGVPAGQVQSGQQQEIETRNRRREEDDNQVVQAIVVPSPGAVPTVSINDVSGNEGNGLTFTVVLSFPSNQPVTVFYSTANGTATAPVDYTAASGFVVIPPGSTTGTIVIQTVADGTGAASIASPVPSGSVVSRGTVSAAAVEPPETFFVNLTSAVGATIGDGQGQGTIVDPGTLTLSINDVSVTEGTGATFTVTLSAASSQPVTVNYTTADGTGGGGAVAPGDYTAASNTLTIPAGQLSGQIVVPTIADAVVEPPENFAVNLTGATVATIADTQGVGTIVDSGTLTLSINDVSATEGANASFTVALSAISSQPVTVNFTTSNGAGVTGAVAPGDYTAVSNTLTIPAGAPSGQIVVTTADDAIDEPDETFFVTLSGATVATILDGQGLGTILDNDTAAVSINDPPAVVEGTGGTTNLTFTVSLSLLNSQTVTVTYSTVNGTAIAPGDFTATTNGSVTIPAGQPSTTIVVPIVTDNIDEVDESFTVTLTGATGAALGDALGVGTIQDDDQAVLSIGNVGPQDEGNDCIAIYGDFEVFPPCGKTPFVFTVTLSTPSDRTVTVNFRTEDAGTGVGFATGGATDSCQSEGAAFVGSPDYELVDSSSSPLSFEPGTALTRPITVQVCADNQRFFNDPEGDEIFHVVLVEPVTGGATISPSQGTGTGTIGDDDEPFEF